ncbi:MAG: tetratricopeptide repeat protein [Persicimonas sp.]
MAITPRTIFSSPVTATVATVSLLAFSAVGALAYKAAQQNTPETHRVVEAPSHDSCDGVREALGADESEWSETDWLVYGACFEQKNNSRTAATVASQGLEHYPKSEALYNMKGYHQIVLGEHAEAVDTLNEGLRRVGNPSNGVMENNLAWAGTWVPREMERQRARSLYRRSLQRNSRSCETLHTGLWVEYATAREERGVEKYHALKNFLELRDRYEPCQARAKDGDWQTLVEVIGANIITKDVEENLNAPNTVPAHGADADEAAEDLRQVTQELRDEYRGVSVDALCREAMPVENTHHLCVDEVSETIDELKQDERKDKDKIIIKRGKSKNSGAPSGCIRSK